MAPINLADFEPKPHRLKPLFQRSRIRQIVLAKFLAVSQSQIAQWLNGYREMPEDVERRLIALTRQFSAAPGSQDIPMDDQNGF